MAFDVTSFLAGVAAGILTGGLAGLLHSLERTADLQEKLRRLSKEVERMTSRGSPNDSKANESSPPEVDRLQRELDEIHEEIRRMYKRSGK
jgi:peptidoglycan hydrolase CwlO-like protein